MSDRIKDFEARLGRRFTDPALLERALTHASHGDGRSRSDSNERLEFLGDRVLGLMAAEALHERFPGLDEGGLASRLNALVNKEACARAARQVDLGEALRLSPAEARLGGREKASILADACEAVIGALYLDGGLEAARGFFLAQWGEALDNLAKRPRDAKSRLQEWAARTGRPAPVYSVIARSGPDHRPVFTVEVSVGALNAQAEGASKQAAERAAADLILTAETRL
ncbi:ribonuclease III [Alkalicaulis satelles]|uniref:Ribonuclease 3 n=1 Tax=Alkalicaulis satelles TaxID=2609175 RepID=A0A5M6ZJ87_9PROT|nr:ribonuclease III [Alkalicaulis satelles]KAA5804873.1 ribonuclease III [Alkalicaulis satelles]